MLGSAHVAAVMLNKTCQATVISADYSLLKTLSTVEQVSITSIPMANGPSTMGKQASLYDRETRQRHMLATELQQGQV
jgi:hypothetical protein